MDMIISYMHSGISAIIPFVILLGILIFVHELGHFLVAKFYGVRVEIFSLGFGKKIFQYKKGDTNYCISLIPLGGYVKMYGDELGGSVPDDQKQFSFTHKPVGQRIAVVLAGPLMNFFFAILIFMIVAIKGEEVRSPIIGDVYPNTTAYQLGFRSGDEIQKVDSHPIQTWDDFQNALTSKLTSGGSKEITVEIKRTGSDLIEKIKTEPRLVPNPNILSLENMIGDIEGVSYQAKGPSVGVLANSIAAKAGFVTGDIFVSIAGKEIKYFREIENTILPLQNQSIEIKIIRANPANLKEVSEKTLTLPKSQFSSLSALGLEGSELYLAKVVENSPASKAGLKENDRILKINDSLVLQWEDIVQLVKNSDGKTPLNLNIQRGNENINLEMIPELSSHMNNQGGEEKRFTIGIATWLQPALPLTKTVKYGGVDSISRGFKRTVDVTVMTVVSFLRLAQAKISPKNIGGVISIGQAASETFKVGISHFLSMMAIISVNLFILNLLPIPVLDGGHLLFYCVEALRGAPISMRKMEIAQQVGLFVLMSLMVFALFNDFSRLLGS